jgi:nitroreductase
VQKRDDMKKRIAAHEILDLILNRWSPRAMSGETIRDEELMSLFEAARWAPSSFDNQPWRFIYAKRESQHWNNFFNLLVDANKEWAKNAAVLIVVVSANNFAYNNKLSRTHSFDTGAAWENLALQGYAQGLVVHGMEGFDYDRAKTALNIPDDHTVEAMIAVGKPGSLDVLPVALQNKEELSDRKKIEEFIFEGEFK